MTHARSLVGVATFAALFSTSLCAQVDWNALSPAAVPQGRSGHAMAYDLVNDRIVLFGGNISGQGFQNDTWLYDGNTWTQVFPNNSPPPRAGHPMAYDISRQRVVLFGGIPSGGGALNDTWEWDGQDWTPVFPNNSPPPKRSHPMVYHPLRQTVVVWGGYDGGQDTNDTWEFNGLDWSQITTANAPSPRRASEMAYDPVTGGLLLFSGYQVGADTWLFDGTDWNALSPATVPSQRYDHTMATDLLRSRIVMFGGNTTGDTWEWDGQDWIQRQPATLPPARYDDYMVWDVIRERVVMFGGIQGTADMWEYRTTAPARFAPFGNGCQGTNGQTPVLGSTDLPWAGEPFDVTVAALPQAGGVFMLVGFSNTVWNGQSLPLDLGFVGMPGCPLLTSINAAYPISNTGGQAVSTLPIPTTPALLGGRFFHQAIVADRGANPLGLTVSNGGDAQIGAR